MEDIKENILSSTSKFDMLYVHQPYAMCVFIDGDLL